MRRVEIIVLDYDDGVELFSARLDEASPLCGAVTLWWDHDELSFVSTSGPFDDGQRA